MGWNEEVHLNSTHASTHIYLWAFMEWGQDTIYFFCISKES